MLSSLSIYILITINSYKAICLFLKTSYIDIVSLPASLKVYYYTCACKILFNSKEASSVIVITNNTSYTLSIKKEVIILVSIFRSLYLLIVSSVSPTTTL
ncbi:hypothetical protein K504DRAFT_394208 [Pleomassaria siparia CBS 279.74]|uniref:Uncharacterized protein n=1 Tax=Pleomassaria siparia CBS 279.74 TaxID=1314801 RepID=A0A6G1JPR6_9PLEO|nr:hypothetical protein K504DRAFT_394208 [Pleomassaria siparia CBS 279.74]